MHILRNAIVVGAFACQWPLWPVRKIIRQNLDAVNYLKVTLLNLKKWNWGIAIERQPHLWVFDDWSDTYFHWTFDVLVKLQLLHAQTGCKQVALPGYLNNNSFVVQSLQLLGFQITVLEPRTYLFKQLIAHVNIPYFSPPVLIDLRQRILLTIKPPAQATRIFISRQYAGRRQLLNEITLFKQLQAKGFELVYLEKMKWQDQVALFQTAEMVVGMHGAGLSNLMYCTRLKLVIELLPASTTNQLYQLLAANLSLPYRAVAIDSQTDPHATNIAISDVAIVQVMNHINSI
ncbi:MAG: glycosyltransferase family 61 protein [Cytophagales bacterium]|nr:glycosyltransferase family 61 protein [Cytophagales bacterium]